MKHTADPTMDVRMFTGLLIPMALAGFSLWQLVVVLVEYDIGLAELNILSLVLSGAGLILGLAWFFIAGTKRMDTFHAPDGSLKKEGSELASRAFFSMVSVFGAAFLASAYIDPELFGLRKFLLVVLAVSGLLALLGFLRVILERRAEEKRIS